MSHEPHRASPPERPAPEQVFFDRHEFNQILRIYGRMVAAGEWRDYAVAGGPEAAVFAIYRRTAEAPVYRIEKRPSLARRQGAFAVIGEGGIVLRRGHSLELALKDFESRKFRLVTDR